MKGKKKMDAKERIFKAALSLFAMKGFAATSIRRIAKKANINISMINYYYGGKIGILKAIINEAYEKYYSAVGHIMDGKSSIEKRVRTIVDIIIRFFRENTEVAIVALDVMPLDMPRIADLKNKWELENRRVMNQFFISLGLDADDDIQMSVFRGALTAIILSHFQSKYVKEHVIQTSAKSRFSDGEKLENSSSPRGDIFYNKYAETLTNVYLYGVKGIRKKQLNLKGGDKNDKNN